MTLRRAPPAAPIDRRSIEITTYQTPARATAPARVTPPALATPRALATFARTTRATPTSRAPAAPSPPAETSAPPSPTPPPPPASRPPSSTTVDLFSRDALGRAVAPSTAPADPGGHLRRAGDPPPPADDERERLTARTREWLDDAAARERAGSGHIAPRWRALERKLAQELRLPVDVVKQESKGKALAHQILRAWLDGPPQGGGVPRAVDPSNEIMLGTPPGFNIRDPPAQQALAVQARWAAPATSLTVEVEVTVDEDGHIVAARVTKPSGRRRFDRTALAAVEDAVRRGGAPDEHCTVVTRWTVEAAVAVQPPTSIGFRFDETGHLDPHATGWRRFLSPTLPLDEQVQSHVSLVAIEERR